MSDEHERANVGHIENEVLIGSDGWLFLATGSNHVLRYYTDLEYLSPAAVEQWVDLLAQRYNNFSSCGVRYFHIFAPDKITILPQHVSVPLPYFDRHPIRLVTDTWRHRGLPNVLVDPSGAMRAAPDPGIYYLKTDTHWTYYAGALVLNMLLQQAGYDRHVAVDGREISRYVATWDLGGKLAEIVQEENIWVKPLDTVRVAFDNPTAQRFRENVNAGKAVLHHQGTNVIYINDDPNAIDEIVVIFGDSFMEFRPSTPTFMFAEVFREVHFIWSANVDYSYVARVNGSLVVTELAERFMVSVPDDQFDLNAMVDRQIREIAQMEAPEG